MREDLRRVVLVVAVLALAIVGSWWVLRDHSNDQGVAAVQDLPPDHKGGVASTPAPAQREVMEPPFEQPVVSPLNPASFLEALGSKVANWGDIYKRGTRPGAALRDKFAALRVLDICFPSLSGFPYPEGLGIPDEEKQKIAAARVNVAERCADIGNVGLDQLRISRATLKGDLETPKSRLWQGYVGFSRSTNKTRFDAASNRLQDVFSEYGPAALYWVGPEFGNYIEESTGPFPQRIKTLDPDGHIYPAAIIVAMCRTTGICGQGGLTYLSTCATGSACSDDGNLGITAGLSETDIEYANTMAGWMIEAIRSNSWR